MHNHTAMIFRTWTGIQMYGKGYDCELLLWLQTQVQLLYLELFKVLVDVCCVLIPAASVQHKVDLLAVHLQCRMGPVILCLSPWLVIRGPRQATRGLWTTANSRASLKIAPFTL